jgi:hypothetical protein
MDNLHLCGVRSLDARGLAALEENLKFRHYGLRYYSLFVERFIRRILAPRCSSQPFPARVRSVLEAMSPV